jgi:membrane dipeptidase
MNAFRGRDITRPAIEQPTIGNEIATVGLPDLRAGAVTHICATIFCEPAHDNHPGYTTWDEAHAMAIAQLDFYDQLERDGLIHMGLTGATMEATNYLLLLEGADAIRDLDDLQMFVERGVRIIGLSWRKSRFAGGTGSPGPITPEGRKLIRQIDELRLIHDASHLAEQSFWQMLDLATRPVIASHSNCRNIVGDDWSERQLTDAMIRALVQRGGIVGINAYENFLLPSTEHGKRRAKLTDMVDHIKRVCDLAGDAKHVGIGTDMDGGLGREQIPQEFTTIADLPKLEVALRDAGFDANAVDDILFNNWYTFFSTHLS